MWQHPKDYARSLVNTERGAAVGGRGVVRPLLGEAGEMGSDIGEEEKLQKGHQAENGITRREE